jgi:hypothetical protein
MVTTHPAPSNHNRGIASVKDIISLWPSAEVFSDDLGLKYRSHGRLMKRRDSIPVGYWDLVVSAAKRRGIDGVTLTTLVRAHARKTAKQAA